MISFTISTCVLLLVWAAGLNAVPTVHHRHSLHSRHMHRHSIPSGVPSTAPHVMFEERGTPAEYNAWRYVQSEYNRLVPFTGNPESEMLADDALVPK